LELRRIAINKIVEDPDQPRKVFDETGLAGLADSLRQHGVLNPITVVPLAESSLASAAGVQVSSRVSMKFLVWYAQRMPSIAEVSS